MRQAFILCINLELLCFRACPNLSCSLATANNPLSGAPPESPGRLKS